MFRATSPFLVTLLSRRLSVGTDMKRFLNHPYIRVCRYDKPAGALLLFWPVTWGLALTHAGLPSLPLLATFFMGSFTSRAAGCIINDYFDRNIDVQVARTKTRPLASKEMGVPEAGALLLLNLTGGLYVLSCMPLKAIAATFLILPVAALYPLAKRYVSVPQLVLALAFNSGVLIGALTMQPTGLDLATVACLYSAGMLWTLVYDSIYAQQDIEDDKKIGVNSSARFWEGNLKETMLKWTLISWLLSCSSVCFSPFLMPSIFFLTPAYAWLYRSVKSLDITSKQQCDQFFKKNHWFGFAIFLSLSFSQLINKIGKKESLAQTKA